MWGASHTTIQESNVSEVESRPGEDTENIESKKLSPDISSIQSTENNRQEHPAFEDNIETNTESKEDEDKDKAKDERGKGFPAMDLPRDESASRLETGI